MRLCAACGHHHINYYGEPQRCLGLIYAQHEGGGISRCPCAPATTY